MKLHFPVYSNLLRPEEAWERSARFDQVSLCIFICSLAWTPIQGLLCFPSAKNPQVVGKAGLGPTRGLCCLTDSPFLQHLFGTRRHSPLCKLRTLNKLRCVPKGHGLAPGPCQGECSFFLAAEKHQVINRQETACNGH